jgi:penicillin amidase
MWLTLALAILNPHKPTPLSRDSYGVPVIRANTTNEAMYWAGYATAQDRLWQMEMSRRTAQSQLAEVFGEKSFSADLQQFQQFYTQTEIREQFETLEPKVQEWFRQYAKGVNKFISEGNLPPQYAENELKPKPWTEFDSAAITIQLVQIFGRGGSGELRNFALYRYLEAQSKIGNRALDVFDDLAWQNDPSAIPTCYAEDDKVIPPKFPSLSPSITLRHLTQLPDLSMFELLPGARVASMNEARNKAESLRTPFQSGSYCVVVSPSMSKTKSPLLLSGPQMGFTIPSIVHEISLHSPDLDVAGMTVPGVPGVLVGATQSAAWGLTTGVADTEDIYLSKVKDGKYKVDDTEKPIKIVSVQVPIKGGEAKFLARRETEFGPIVYEVPSKFIGFSRKRVYAKRELKSYEAVSGLWNVKSKADFEATVSKATMNFNCFIALKTGDIGWRYLGEVPLRAPGYDPRFPLPSKADALWRGIIPFKQMPAVWNPKRGWIANWNNKPTDWWPNMDTPTWGEAFRNHVIIDQIGRNKLGPQDLMQMVENIGKTSTSWKILKPFSAVGPLSTYSGALVDGASEPALYNRYVSELRNEVFLPTTGNFASPDNFALVAQPDVIVKALRGETKFNFLQGKSASEVSTAAMDRAIKATVGKQFKASTIPVPVGEPILFRDRGTYLQIIEVGNAPVGRNVLTPGVSESGEHSFDQVQLARTWSYKAMVLK